jgi:hypothetical protein
MKLMKLFIIGACLALSASVVAEEGRVSLTPRPLRGELIDVTCFVVTNGSIGEEYKSCVSDYAKNGKTISFALLTQDGDVYVLVRQKGEGFEGFNLGDQVQLNGMRTVMVGGLKKIK